MEVKIIGILFFVFISICIALIGYYLAKYIEENPKKFPNWDKGKKIRYFFIKYYWLIGIIVFILLILFKFLLNLK